MPLQNRVTPEGEIIADSARGMFMGNRGILHNAGQTLGKKRWTHQGWVTCALSFGERKRTLMAPGRYTELFFLDEAVSLAAGHRPCGECRKADLQRFRQSWEKAYSDKPTNITRIDRQLHKARVDPRTRSQIRYEASINELPDGVFVYLINEGRPCLTQGPLLLPYSPAGYGIPIPRPSNETVLVLTPRPSVLVLAAGYRPRIHPTAMLYIFGDPTRSQDNF